VGELVKGAETHSLKIHHNVKSLLIQISRTYLQYKKIFT